jgi:hypothetical protein
MHAWSRWFEDGHPNRIKTVTIDTDITLTAVYTRPTPVGGKATPIDIVTIKPMNNPKLLAPYIALTILLTVAAVTVGYVKKRKRNTRIIS